MRSIACCGMLFALTLSLGCGGTAAQPDTPGDEDSKKIAELVDRLNDNSGRANQLKQMFAVGAAPGGREAAAYQQYRFDLKGKPNVTGTTATGTVAIEKQAGGEPVEKEWNFVKEGDKWKIKSAPMP